MVFDMIFEKDRYTYQIKHPSKKELIAVIASITFLAGRTGIICHKNTQIEQEQTVQYNQSKAAKLDSWFKIDPRHKQSLLDYAGSGYQIKEGEDIHLHARYDGKIEFIVNNKEPLQIKRVENINLELLDSYLFDP